MSREIALVTPLSVFAKLHEAATSRKMMVPVDRDYLALILTDHTTLVNACKASGIRIVEPPSRKRAELK